jgi:hypothetical protein
MAEEEQAIQDTLPEKEEIPEKEETPAKRPRGGPPKPKAEPEPPKRPPGRPRKVVMPNVTTPSEVASTSPPVAPKKAAPKKPLPPPEEAPVPPLTYEDPYTALNHLAAVVHGLKRQAKDAKRDQWRGLLL